MITKKILKILKENSQFKEFLKNFESCESLIKKLNHNELERFILEYPNLIQMFTEVKIDENKTKLPILCLTLVKRDIDEKNYSKLKKIKLYIDEINQKILKILEN